MEIERRDDWCGVYNVLYTAYIYIFIYNICADADG